MDFQRSNGSDMRRLLIIEAVEVSCLVTQVSKPLVPSDESVDSSANRGTDIDFPLAHLPSGSS